MCISVLRGQLSNLMCSSKQQGLKSRNHTKAEITMHTKHLACASSRMPIGSAQMASHKRRRFVLTSPCYWVPPALLEQCVTCASANDGRRAASQLAHTNTTAEPLWQPTVERSAPPGAATEATMALRRAPSPPHQDPLEQDHRIVLGSPPALAGFKESTSLSIKLSPLKDQLPPGTIVGTNSAAHQRWQQHDRRNRPFAVRYVAICPEPFEPAARLLLAEVSGVWGRGISPNAGGGSHTPLPTSTWLRQVAGVAPVPLVSGAPVAEPRAAGAAPGTGSLGMGAELRSGGQIRLGGRGQAQGLPYAPPALQPQLPLVHPVAGAVNNHAPGPWKGCAAVGAQRGALDR
jgi:hypothetical protein